MKWDLDWMQAPWVARGASFGMASTIFCVFALSALLVPAAEGHGTHTQLGLGSCSFLMFTGQPCPMCGATTSFTLFAHLHPWAAFVNQPFASLLFVLAAGTMGIAVAETVDPRGRWGRLSRWLEPREGWMAMAFLGLMALGWIYKMVQMS